MITIVDDDLGGCDQCARLNPTPGALPVDWCVIAMHAAGETELRVVCLCTECSPYRAITDRPPVVPS